MSIVDRSVEAGCGITRKPNGALVGAVDGGQGTQFHLDRMEEVLDQVAPGRGLADGDRTDNFAGDRFADDQLSLDNAGAYEEGLSDYRAGEDITGHEGVVPCDLTGRPRDPKIGVSGRRTWQR
ncbi:hypothetical protein A2714_00910 [Candidatus Woesebacteria bacterium RIFCSPHIGHO2_01_FULL_38_9]|uniref:Uncharacterized protein n=2 Tax=Candidatus Woeseibacteriota TaxID=1752722 RepID=A0A1F7Y136_9BACT|nr:MAG: hypothetical protein A2714_00910 [Candidatus Woesebacteria bacterium RIFCSPHIGHO2_01_FULL_38_9]OGM59727.1 MAG: hypothetical protein A3A75_02115 [Candidatus Woesebacteria bacterium RIFCSPLOWO2_01_FULL_39_10]